MRITQPAKQITLKTREPARTKTKQHQLTGKGQYGRIDDGGESMRRELVIYSVATEAGSEKQTARQTGKRASTCGRVKRLSLQSSSDEQGGSEDRQAGRNTGMYVYSGARIRLEMCCGRVHVRNVNDPIPYEYS